MLHELCFVHYLQTVAEFEHNGDLVQIGFTSSGKRTLDVKSGRLKLFSLFV